MRKLGREKSLGVCTYEPGGAKIEIDPRQSAREMMDTALHEALHAALPDLPEAKVRATANTLTAVLWRLGYRKVET